MSKYKVSVYAICKNEELFVDRWYESMKEADEIYVLDTGSDDNTVEKLKEKGINVTVSKIEPWRFDVARNKSLDLVSDDTDICVCTDLDEVFEIGWREKLEKYWEKDTTRGCYNYIWSFDKNNNPAVNFYIEKMHRRHDYEWTHPVHEVLSYCGPNEEKITFIDEVTLNHYPDSTKSRSSYLPLLELSVSECPNDDRNMHYLGREYMYYQMWDKCIETLHKHLELPTATWKDERSASMRFIARAYKKLGKLNLARIWLEKAINETPYLREPLVEMGMLEYNEKNYKDAITYLEKALEIKDRYKSYINEPFCYDATVYDLLSICKYYTGDYKDSLYYITKALKMDSDNERLINNRKIIENKI